MLHQDIDLFFLEFAQDLLALGLRNVAVKDFGRIAAFQEFGHDLVRARSGAGEDDAVELGFDVDDAGQGVELVAFAHLEIDLVRQMCIRDRCNGISDCGFCRIFCQPPE